MAESSSRIGLFRERESPADAFGWALMLIAALSGGCASITSRLPTRMHSDSSSDRPIAVMQQTQSPASAKNRSLEIALETAHLAEQRAMDAEAIAAYEEVRRLNPKQRGVAHALAVLYDRAAMTDAAQREYAAAIAESPGDADVLCDYGYFLYSTGKVEEAEQTLRTGLAADADHRQAMINLAVVLATVREYEEAKTLFEEAIGPAAALHNIGVFKIRQGEAAEGERMIAAALATDPSIRQAQAVLDHVAVSRAVPLAADANGLH